MTEPSDASPWAMPPCQVATATAALSSSSVAGRPRQPPHQQREGIRLQPVATRSSARSSVRRSPACRPGSTTRPAAAPGAPPEPAARRSRPGGRAIQRAGGGARAAVSTSAPAAAALHRSNAVRASRPCWHSPRQPQAGQRLDADGQQVGALAQADHRIGQVAPVRLRASARPPTRPSARATAPAAGTSADARQAACAGFQTTCWPPENAASPRPGPTSSTGAAAYRAGARASHRRRSSGRAMQQAGVDATDWPGLPLLRSSVRPVSACNWAAGWTPADPSPASTRQVASSRAGASQRTTANRPTQPSRASQRQLAPAPVGSGGSSAWTRCWRTLSRRSGVPPAQPRRAGLRRRIHLVRRIARSHGRCCRRLQPPSQLTPGPACWPARPLRHGWTR